MKTYIETSKITAPENTPFEGQEMTVFTECENGRTYENIFSEYGFLAIFK